MRLADLIAPVPLDRFEAETFGRRPLHIPTPAGAAKAPLDWPHMNRLLALASHWSEANIKLIMDNCPVQPRLYLDEVAAFGRPARRANPAKVDLFLAMGASLVANSLEEISPEVRAVVVALGDHYHAQVGANAYCSFGGIQAFASHCDPHEVFAIQCEGEKVWRIYENRVEAPVDRPAGDDARALIDSAKGAIRMEVRMRPGDLLYIPRGYYHDAMASAEASLHVTFAVAPLSGGILFRILEALAIEDSEFREYLPDARREGGRALARRLETLAGRASELLLSPRFARELGLRQRALKKPDHGFHLPGREKLAFFARTEQEAELIQDGTGAAALTTARGRTPIGDLAEPAQWLLGRPGFSLQELFVRFPSIDRTELSGLVARFEDLGLVLPLPSRPE
jgi:lysine-specific demethylase/histidyl-hydroxylase NO66